MNYIRILKTLVATALVTYIAWFFTPLYLDHQSDFENQLVSYHGHGAILPIEHPLMVGISFVSILAAYVGIFFIQRWGKYLFLVLLLLDAAIAPFSGYRVDTPFESMLSGVNYMLDGAILALVYLSPLSASFQSAPNKPLEPTR